MILIGCRTAFCGCPELLYRIRPHKTSTRFPPKGAGERMPEKRELSDAEAREHYFNPDFGKCTVCTYSIKKGEIIRSVPEDELLGALMDELNAWNG